MGRDQHAVHYRHVIDSLMRKPGAFANYAYRDDLFPTTRFRMAYDRFCDGGDERRGAKEYLKMLHHAAHNSEVAVDDALRVLLASDTALSVASGDRVGAGECGASGRDGGRRGTAGFDRSSMPCCTSRRRLMAKTRTGEPDTADAGADAERSG